MAKYWGEFTTELDLRILPPPGKRLWWEWIFPRRPEAELRSYFGYIDPDGRSWASPAGAKINGLTTPRVFWRLMPPFSWRGIRAAALHDFACERKNRPSWRVHRMMYHAMRCDYESPPRAWVAWAVVRAFGPRFPGTRL